MQIPDMLVNDVGDNLRITKNEDITIRSVQRLLTEMALIPSDHKDANSLDRDGQILVSGLLILKVYFPDIYKKALNGELNFQNIVDCFVMYDGQSRNMKEWKDQTASVWKAFLSPNGGARPGARGPDGRYNGRRILKNIIREKLEAVKIGAYFDD